MRSSMCTALLLVGVLLASLLAAGCGTAPSASPAHQRAELEQYCVNVGLAFRNVEFLSAFDHPIGPKRARSILARLQSELARATREAPTSFLRQYLDPSWMTIFFAKPAKWGASLGRIDQLRQILPEWIRLDVPKPQWFFADLADGYQEQPDPEPTWRFVTGSRRACPADHLV